MGTIVGVECTDGVLLAGDRTLVEGGTVRSTDRRRVFDFGDVGAAVVGRPSATDQFERELDGEVRRYRTERDERLRIDPFARVASSVAASLGAEVLVAARDDDGVPRLRSVRADGTVYEDRRAALGSGEPLAVGPLDAADPDLTLAEADELVDEVFAVLAERDPGTGDAVDRWRLRAGDV
ncbi:MAG: 20S proteasome subunit A/B [Haloferacaceae archaeon]